MPHRKSQVIVTVAAICLLLIGCDDMKLCHRCKKTAEPPKTVINHSMFEFRFAPPWFNADQRLLFTSYVVFPKEANFQEWIDNPNPNCRGENASAAVCPDRAFHEEVTGPFLKALARCAILEKKVTLRTVGFASSSGIDVSETATPPKLSDLYLDHVSTIADVCFAGKNVSDVSADENDPSRQFNLLVANQRARNVAEMLRSFTSNEKFDIEATPWCSHADMAAQRSHNDRSNDKYNSAKGLMNRRAEVRLVDLAGCLNVDPDNRLDSGKQTSAQQ